MGLFLSTIVNRIDRKGRISVPGLYRAALENQPFFGVILMKSPIHPALEGFAPSTMEDIAERLDAYPMFSQDQDDLAAATLAEAVPLYFDGEGRIGLPADLAAYAGLQEDVVFVGLGRKFQMWAPDAWKKRREVAQKSVKSKGLVLPKQAGGS